MASVPNTAGYSTQGMFPTPAPPPNAPGYSTPATYPMPAPPRGYTPNVQRAVGPEPVVKPGKEMGQRNVTSNQPGIASSNTQMTNFDNRGQQGVKVSKSEMNGTMQSTTFTEQGADSLRKRNVVGSKEGAEFGSGKVVEGEDEEYPDVEKEGEDVPESKKKKWARRLGKLTACIGCKVACTAALCACIHTYPCHAACCCGL